MLWQSIPTVYYTFGTIVSCLVLRGYAIKSQRGFLFTNTSISLQDKTRFAGTLEAAQCVQTVSVLTDALHGALVDVFRVSRSGGGKDKIKIRKDS